MLTFERYHALRAGETIGLSKLRRLRKPDNDRLALPWNFVARGHVARAALR